MSSCARSFSACADNSAAPHRSVSDTMHEVSYQDEGVPLVPTAVRSALWLLTTLVSQPQCWLWGRTMSIMRASWPRSPLGTTGHRHSSGPHAHAGHRPRPAGCHQRGTGSAGRRADHRNRLHGGMGHGAALRHPLVDFKRTLPKECVLECDLAFGLQVHGVDGMPHRTSDSFRAKFVH
jgi:hypothetical protein